MSCALTGGIMTTNTTLPRQVSRRQERKWTHMYRCRGRVGTTAACLSVPCLEIHTAPCNANRCWVSESNFAQRSANQKKAGLPPRQASMGETLAKEIEPTPSDFQAVSPSPKSSSSRPFRLPSDSGLVDPIRNSGGSMPKSSSVKP